MGDVDFELFEVTDTEVHSKLEVRSKKTRITNEALLIEALGYGTMRG